MDKKYLSFGKVEIYLLTSVVINYLYGEPMLRTDAPWPYKLAFVCWISSLTMAVDSTIKVSKKVSENKKPKLRLILLLILITLLMLYFL